MYRGIIVFDNRHKNNALDVDTAQSSFIMPCYEYTSGNVIGRLTLKPPLEQEKLQQ